MEEEIVCPRCGNKYSPDARNCLNCGRLNYDHPDNIKYKKYDKFDVVRNSFWTKKRNGNGMIKLIISGVLFIIVVILLLYLV